VFVLTDLNENHYSQQPGGSLESWVSADFKLQAYALILLWPTGLPCVFQGDLDGIPGVHGSPALPLLDQLIRARKLFAYGSVKTYFDHPRCIGFVRAGNAGHSGCAVILRLPNGPSSKRMFVGLHHAGTTWSNFLATSQTIAVSRNGFADFTSDDGVAVWVQIPHSHAP